MIIQHNIMALNAHRQLGGNNGQVSKNLEKLSSGYRINRAGDDAAGLAISEKMRSQIKGLERAQANAQDGISLVQTAEGALTEVHSMLNRLVELGTESANGTIQASDRQKIQDEVDALTSEIDRISKATNFNGIKLLDGSLGSNSSAGSVNGAGAKAVYVDGAATLTINSATKDKFVAGGVIAAASSTVTYTNAKGDTVNKTFSGADAAAVVAAIKDDAELSSLFTISGTNADAANGLTFESKTAGANAPKVTGLTTGATGLARAVASVSGADASVDIALNGFDAAHKTITVGDKTYELVANDAADGTEIAKSGNIAVGVATADLADAAKVSAALIKALQKNGVTSASDAAATGGTANHIKISDVSQISVAQKGPSITVSGDSGVVSSSTATANKFSLTDAVGTADSQTLTFNYIDESGTAKSVKVNYTGSTTANTNTTNILNALKANDEFSKHFSIDGSSNIVSNTQGSNGAKVTGLTTTDTATAVANRINFSTTQVGKDAGQTLEFTEIKEGTTVTVNGKTYEFVRGNKEAASGIVGVKLGDTLNDSTKNLAILLKDAGIGNSYAAGKISFDGSGASSNGGGLTLQIGDTADDFNKVTVSVGDMSSAGLGIKGIKVTDQGLSADAITNVNKAVELVSTARGQLGALQNRLEHTINNLGVTTENMTAAESRIRDVDMAKEMMNFTKNNVLTQAAQAMLAQANQQPQQVLQLLR